MTNLLLWSVRDVGIYASVCGDHRAGCEPGGDEARSTELHTVSSRSGGEFGAMQCVVVNTAGEQLRV